MFRHLITVISERYLLLRGIFNWISKFPKHLFDLAKCTHHLLIYFLKTYDRSKTKVKAVFYYTIFFIEKEKNLSIPHTSLLYPFVLFFVIHIFIYFGSNYTISTYVYVFCFLFCISIFLLCIYIIYICW